MRPGEQKKIRLTLSPQAERYVQRDAPRDVRLMASKGALPLPPIDLATVLFALMHDEDPEVKATARESLETLPDTITDVVLSGATHPAILSHLARAFRESEDRLERVALNATTDDSTIVFLASLPFRRIVDIVSNNQERMLRSHEIVEALGHNPLTGRAVIERILSFLGLDGMGGGGDDAPVVLHEAQDVSDEEAEAALRAVLGDDMGEYARDFLVDDADAPPPELKTLDEEAEEAEEEPDGGNLYALIQNMTVMQKIKIARMGNKEARGLLVRDRNKIVAISAVSSPKITIQEIAVISKSRNVSDDVLRVITRNRDWTRNYQVKVGLATNPKCPTSEAVKFVNYLQDRELRNLMRSKDVSTAISTHARRLLTKRGKL